MEPMDRGLHVCTKFSEVDIFNIFRLHVIDSTVKESNPWNHEIENVFSPSKTKIVVCYGAARGDCKSIEERFCTIAIFKTR